AAASDGNLWFTEQAGNKIGSIDSSTHAITETTIPTANAMLFGIAAGPDAPLWVTEFAANKSGASDTPTATHHRRAPRTHTRRPTQSRRAPPRPPAPAPSGSRRVPTATSGSPRSSATRSE